MYADETEIKCRKRDDVFWCAVDWNTRLINASLYSPRSQNMEDAIDFMRMIKKTTKPTFIQTDALQMYPRAFRKAFYSRYSKDYVEHRINNYTKTKKHNVRVFPEGRSQRTLERLGSVPHFTLVYEALLVGMYELDRVFERQDVFAIVGVDPVEHGRDGGGFSGSGNSGQQDHPLIELAQFLHDRRQI